MSKRSINLVIRKERESLLVRRIRKMLPVVAGTYLVLFLVLFGGLFVFLNTNIDRFSIMKNEAKLLEDRIGAQKATEGIYSLTAATLSVTQKIVGSQRKLGRIYREIQQVATEGTSVSFAGIDKTGKVTIDVLAASDGVLETFVNGLLSKERDQEFSDITATSVLRDKSGLYTMTITMKVNPKLLL